MLDLFLGYCHSYSLAVGGNSARNVTSSNLPSLSRQVSKQHIVFTIDRGGEMPPETIKRVAAAPLASEQKPSPSPTPDSIGCYRVISFSYHVTNDAASTLMS